MASRSSREIKRALEQGGWYAVHTAGSHWQFKHPTKPGRVTVPPPKKRNSSRYTQKH
ncbi:type II toxin-antitoxin system HicA family toxin [Brevibacillus panacihumi]|uniref:type II toxin-antitoxin system HicA family toxin n=1 Tax=Brevibacillus panacihumi TaxID=497735 RepID=UPI003CFF815C